MVPGSLKTHAHYKFKGRLSTLVPYSISDEKLVGGQQMSKSVSVLVSIKGTQRWAGRELFLETCTYDQLKMLRRENSPIE